MKNRLVDIASANLEPIFDSLLENGLLKDLPLIGNIANMLRLKGDVTNFLFARKLETFINKLQQHNINFIENKVADKEELKKIGTDLVFIIDSINNLDKAAWLAQTVVGLVEKKYDLATFQRLTHVVDNFSPPLIEVLRIYYKKRELSSGQVYVDFYDGDYPEELANMGLLQRQYGPQLTDGRELIVNYRICNLGQHFWYVISNA